MPYNPKEVRRRKVLITYNILHKQDAGPSPEHQTLQSPEEEGSALQPEGSRKKEGSNNLQHPAQARRRTHTGTSNTTIPRREKRCPTTRRKWKRREVLITYNTLHYMGFKPKTVKVHPQFIKYSILCQ
jgi:hypothetical protein